MIQTVGEQESRKESQCGQNECRREHHANEVVMLVTHGFQCGKFKPIIGDLGKQNLVDNHHADNQSHDGAKVEDKANGCCTFPVKPFMLKNFFIGINFNKVIELFAQFDFCLR